MTPATTPIKRWFERMRVLLSRGLVRRLGGLRLTALLLLLLLASIWWLYVEQGRDVVGGYAHWFTGSVLAGLVVNLVAAISSNGRFRRQPPLLMFHLSLVVLVCLVGIGHLTRLKATVEVSSGAWFEGDIEIKEVGLLHGWAISELRFQNRDFRIHYNPGPSRGNTYNHLRWLDDAGTAHDVVIGDQLPLRIAGYRFYTSFNKGFAPQFAWRANTGEMTLGDVHLPSYPGNSTRQAIEWTVPGTDTGLWIQLDFDEEILSTHAPSVFRTPTEHQLVVRSGDRRVTLRPGQRMRLPEGELVYQGLGTWMGYSIYYDETRYWLLAASLLAIFSLGWFYWQRFTRIPWNSSIHETTPNTNKNDTDKINKINSQPQTSVGQPDQ